MTKRYKTLQKKLQELEAELSLIFSLPAETPYHHLLSECIQQRFAFLKKLLSAEIASHPSKPSHLRHIGKRVTELEIAFSEWDDYRRSDINYNFDTASVCSCNGSSRDDDGEAASDLPNPELPCFQDELQQNSPRATVNVEGQEEEGKVGNEDLAGSFEHEVQQNNMTPLQVKVKTQEAKEKVGNEVAVEKKEGRISASGKYCGVLIGGMILGMILMGAAIVIVGDCGSSYSTLHESFLFPT